MVAVIIPAKDEEERIGTVLRAVVSASLPDEIIVVSDGSEDRTADAARRFPGVRVIELPANRGKGGAMAAGVAFTRADVVTFLDADLVGLTGAHVDNLIRPVTEEVCEMTIGVFQGGKFWSTSAQVVAPNISGQRAMRRTLFEGVPYVSDMRMGIEVALNSYAKRTLARVVKVRLYGVSNTHKEKKLGLVRGAAARAKMWAEIGRAVVRMRSRDMDGLRSRPRPPRRRRTRKGP